MNDRNRINDRNRMDYGKDYEPGPDGMRPDFEMELDNGTGGRGVIVVKAPSRGFLVVKCVGILVAGFLILSLLLSFLMMASGALGDPEDVEMVSWCESDYVNRDYARLYDTLTLFDLYGERYALYWEAVDGYGLYIDVVQWSRGGAGSGEDGGEPAGEAPDAPGAGKAAEMGREALSELRRLADDPEFPRNSDLLMELVQKAEAELNIMQEK